MKPVTLAVFNSREEAEPVRQFLCGRGVWAEIRLERGETVYADYARSSTGVRVEVPREDFEEALKLIYDWNVGVESGENVSWMPWEAKGDESQSRESAP